MCLEIWHQCSMFLLCILWIVASLSLFLYFCQISRPRFDTICSTSAGVCRVLVHNASCSSFFVCFDVLFAVWVPSNDNILECWICVSLWHILLAFELVLLAFRCYFGYMPSPFHITRNFDSYVCRAANPIH